jgi:hypothetical protein
MELVCSPGDNTNCPNQVSSASVAGMFKNVISIKVLNMGNKNPPKRPHIYSKPTEKQPSNSNLHSSTTVGI